jgi:hypothetical protein
LNADDRSTFDAFADLSKRVKDLASPEAIAEFFGGISGPTIRRYWRLRDAKEYPDKIKPSSRRAMIAFVTGYKKDGDGLLERIAAAWGPDGDSIADGAAGGEGGRPADDEWRLELEAANRRASALDYLARAELAHAEASKIHAEATKIRAEALTSQTRAAENDSERAARARSPERLLYEVMDLTGPEAARIIAALQDRAREQGTAPGGETATPEERAG